MLERIKSFVRDFRASRNINKNSSMGLWIGFFAVMVFLIGLTCGLAIQKNPFIKDSNNKEDEDGLSYEVRLREDYKYINPLLECDSNIPTYKSTKNLRQNLVDYIQDQTKKGYVTNVGLYYRDLNNGPWMDINGDIEFSPSSLMKVPIMIAYFKIAETKPEVLSNLIKNNLKVDVDTNQNFKPQEELEYDKDYSIDDLIRRMIIYSDNQAADLLFKHLASGDLLKIYNDLGLDLPKDNTEANISVRGYGSFFRILYNSSYLNKDLSEKALTLLSQAQFQQGLVAGVPEGIPIAHKFGERFFENTGERQLHDCGIVYAANGPYLLCIMTKGTSFDNLTTVIRDISSKVYNDANSN